ncbi:MAG: ParB/RepB/Spo0J family partition protein [Micavibrio sp.]
MTLQTLSLAQLQASAENPRKTFNDESIAGLAQSIKTDGLLQNLVVFKPKGKAKKFQIISGERRFRALQMLQKTGDLGDDYQIPVEIREDLTEDEILRIATVENVQRENLPPLEEAAALAALVQNGEKIDDIVAQTGLAISTIRRRLVLIGLCQSVKDALSEGKITLSQAEALSLGSHDEQTDLVEDVISGHYTTAEDIKDRLIGELPTLAQAIFAQDLYTGSFTKDLLAEEDATYFNDVEQFYELQKQAAIALVERYKTSHEWAEFDEGYSFQSWEYGKAAEGEKGGVVVFFKNAGSVEIHEGLTKTRADRATTQSLKTKPRDTYPAPLRRYMGMHKSLAVQAALLANPRKAKELAVCNKLTGFKSHECLGYFEKEGTTPPALVSINEEARNLLGLLDEAGEETTWRDLGSLFRTSQVTAYDAIQNLDDAHLERILTVLEAWEFGQQNVDRLDTYEASLFNRIAKDLGVDMRDYWTADEGFLKRRNKVQLQQIMNESGASETLASAAEYKKGDLVGRLTKYLSKAKKAKKPTDAEVKAQNWLPEAMQFPAIDPDGKGIQEPEESYEDEDYSEPDDE